MEKTTFERPCLKSKLAAYFWYRKQFRAMTVEQLLDLKFESGSVERLAQKHALGYISSAELLLLQIHQEKYRKAKAEGKIITPIEAIFATCK